MLTGEFLSADGTLISALAAEHKYELESAAAQPEVPAFIESFKAQGVWNIEDTAGSDDIVLTRKFGNETYVFNLFHDIWSSIIANIQ